VLALTPGSVTPFGLIDDAQRRVTVVLDEEMFDSEWVKFHPLHNAASTTSDLLRFIRASLQADYCATAGSLGSL
jgi:Ala-tRNA(Pro) deacylase